MAKTPVTQREAQALLEVGGTEVAPRTAVLLTVAFLATMAVVTVLQSIADLRGPTDHSLWPRLRSLVAEIPRAVETATRTGLLSTNRRLQDDIDRFEDKLENESVLRKRILPVSQRILTDFLGVGNEQAYLGRDGWLFYREDFEHVTGRGFLEPSVLRSADLAGQRAADPLPAILELQRELKYRGVELVIVPTPVKPTIHPEYLYAKANPRELIHNSSFEAFVAGLTSAGVRVFDPAATLAAAKLGDQKPLFLRTDTHWTPAAMDTVARALADRINELAGWETPPVEFRRRSMAVEGTGDIAMMLNLLGGATRFPPETVETLRVMNPQGRSWRPSTEAEILVLGDSFTNVYSDPSLGWGSGAGLAEQLSFHLGRPVDRMAVNDGGALSSRQALQRALQSGPDRLDPKRIVIYQFATRELTGGDWQLLAFPTANSARQDRPLKSSPLPTDRAQSPSGAPISALGYDGGPSEFEE